MVRVQYSETVVKLETLTNRSIQEVIDHMIILLEAVKY